MYVVAFDVWGAWGLFRKPYSPLSPVSFPFPPPPTVLGLIGAICGYGKEEYHTRAGWEAARIGVALRSPTRRVRIGLNRLNTKDGTDAFWRPRKDASRMQIPCELLSDPAFRLFVHLPEAPRRDLEARLRAGESVYTPSLGTAACLASLAFVCAGEASPTEGGDLCSVVPLSDGVTVDYDPCRPYVRLRVPAVMSPERRVMRYQEVVCATDAAPVAARGVEAWKLGESAFAFL